MFETLCLRHIVFETLCLRHITGAVPVLPFGFAGLSCSFQFCRCVVEMRLRRTSRRWGRPAQTDKAVTHSGEEDVGAASSSESGMTIGLQSGGDVVALWDRSDLARALCFAQARRFTPALERESSCDCRPCGPTQGFAMQEDKA